MNGPAGSLKTTGGHSGVGFFMGGNSSVGGVKSVCGDDEVEPADECQVLCKEPGLAIAS